MSSWLMRSPTRARVGKPFLPHNGRATEWGGSPVLPNWPHRRSFPGCMPVDCTTHGRTFTQAEVKRRSLVGLGIGPDASPVFSDDALHRGKSHAGAFKLLVGVKPLKCSKKLVGILRIESCAIVANEKHKLAVDC